MICPACERGEHNLCIGDDDVQPCGCLDSYHVDLGAYVVNPAARRYRYLSEGWTKDGHDHIRDLDGFCGSCGATILESHYRLVKAEVTDPETMRARRRGLEIDQEGATS